MCFGPPASLTFQIALVSEPPAGIARLSGFGFRVDSALRQQLEIDVSKLPPESTVSGTVRIAKRRCYLVLTDQARISVPAGVAMCFHFFRDSGKRTHCFVFARDISWRAQRFSASGALEYAMTSSLSVCCVLR